MNILHLSPCQGACGGIEAFVLAVADQLHKEGSRVEVLFKKVVGFKLQESLKQALSGREYSISFLRRGDIRTIARKIVEKPHFLLPSLGHWRSRQLSDLTSTWDYTLPYY